MANIKEQILDVLKDQDFAQSILTMTPEEAQAAFKEKGVEIALEDIIAAGEQIDQIIKSRDELSEENLDMVAGGGKAGDAAAGVIVGFFLAVGGFIAGLAGCSW